jgi:hypothetical protein
MSALITKRNNPSVTIVIGSVRITRMGLTSALSTASTNARMSEVVNESICTPERRYDDKPKATRAVMRMRIRKFMVAIFTNINYFYICLMMQH